jgi:iron complex transport system permease protein
VLFAAAAVVVLAALLGLCAGPSGVDLAWLRPEESPALRLRGGRVLLALVVGAALSATGAALQALLRNPLADPFIIGVSGGAAVGGSLAVAAGAATFALAVPGAAVLGAFAASAGLAWFVSREGGGRSDATLLAGVVFNAFAAAVVTLIKTLLPAEQSYTLLFWLVGTVGYVSPAALFGVSAACVVGVGALIALSGPLELLSLGEREAARLGVHTARSRLLVYGAASLLVGAVVPVTGLIGFVGLVVPHALRLVLGPDQRLLLPASALFGAAALVAFDAAVRLAFPLLGTELPVGALTAIVGAPVFGWLLVRRTLGGRS